MERHLVGPLERMRRGREAVLERVAAREPTVREWTPGPDRWSLADVVEHLVLVEGHLYHALAREPTLERPRVVPPGQWFRYLALRLALKGGFRIKAPVDIVLPRRELPWHALLARWEEQRRGLEEWLRASDPRIHRTPRFKHPIVGWLNVPQALTFAADHLDHHLGQIGRIERHLARHRGGQPSNN